MADDDAVPCRVCGREFVPTRSDAVTCSDRCRQRRHRGEDLAYLADLPPKVRRLEREAHRAREALQQANREASAARRTSRAAARNLKLMRLRQQIEAEIRAENLAKEIERFRQTAAENIKAEQKAERRYDAPVAAALNHLGPQATPEDIAALLKRSADDVRQSLTRLKSLPAS
jgi:hypothetical protein